MNKIELSFFKTNFKDKNGVELKILDRVRICNEIGCKYGTIKFGDVTTSATNAPMFLSRYIGYYIDFSCGYLAPSSICEFDSSQIEVISEKEFKDYMNGLRIENIIDSIEENKENDDKLSKFPIDKFDFYNSTE